MIIDYFPFFIEKELLELRIHLLKNHVDRFVISETNKTHSGENKDFICKKLIEELNLPKEKIQVIETKIAEDNELFPEECDFFYCTEAKSTKVNNWVRERIQRDALMSIINEFDDTDVIISSDCDEIINPSYISLFSEQIVHPYLENAILKIPLVLLERKADKRVFSDNKPVMWDKSMVICTAKHLKNNGSPQKFRGDCGNNYYVNWLTDMDKNRFEDCGWHFTWMGDENTIKYKAKTSVLCETDSSAKTLKIVNACIVENTTDETLKNYSHELLPKIIFDLPNVKKFLLESD